MVNFRGAVPIGRVPQGCWNQPVPCTHGTSHVHFLSQLPPYCGVPVQALSPFFEAQSGLGLGLRAKHRV